MKRITMSLPDDLASRVEHEARRRSVSVSELIRESLVRDFAGERERRIAWAGMIDDASLPTGEGFEDALAESIEHATRRDRR